MSDEGENTLSILFARNPLDLTDDNIDRLIEHYRETRAIYKQTGKVKVPKAAVNLTELGLLDED